jgi:hypothetical protein
LLQQNILTMSNTMTSSNNDLFDRPSVSISQVLSDVFHIYFTNWKQLVLMSSILYLVSYGVGFAIGLAIVAEQSGVVSKLINQIPGIHLPDHTPSSSGASTTYGSRLLLAGNDSDADVFVSGASRLLQEDMAEFKEAIQSMGFSFVLMIILVVVAIGFFTSVYSGAIAHVVAEFYTGEPPTTEKSMRYGWSMKWKVYINSLIYITILLASGFIMIGVPVFFLSNHKDEDEDNGMGGLLIIELMVFMIALIVSQVVFVAVVPAIVVEKASPVHAFQRSWNLCNYNFCLIFCAHAVFRLIVFCSTLLTSVIMSTLGVPEFLYNTILNVLCAPFQVV